MIRSTLFLFKWTAGLLKSSLWLKWKWRCQCQIAGGVGNTMQNCQQEKVKKRQKKNKRERERFRLKIKAKMRERKLGQAGIWIHRQQGERLDKEEKQCPLLMPYTSGCVTGGKYSVSAVKILVFLTFNLLQNIILLFYKDKTRPTAAIFLLHNLRLQFWNA